MAVFDQRGQHVQTQYNAETMSFAGVQTSGDLVRKLEQFNAQVDRAKTAGALDSKTAKRVKMRVDEATEEAQAPKPDKATMVQSLTEAKGLIEKVPAAAGAVAGLVTALAQAAQQVQIHF